MVGGLAGWKTKAKYWQLSQHSWDACTGHIHRP